MRESTPTFHTGHRWPQINDNLFIVDDPESAGQDDVSLIPPTPRQIQTTVLTHGLQQLRPRMRPAAAAAPAPRPAGVPVVWSPHLRLALFA